MSQVTILTQRAKSLTDVLFSLEEPWRGRFLDLVSIQATGESWTWSGEPPSQEKVTCWLGDRNLYENVTRILHTWQRL